MRPLSPLFVENGHTLEKSTPFFLTISYGKLLLTMIPDYFESGSVRAHFGAS
jgi:hypothetical protein